MSLTDGTSKMSKSDPVEGSRINLTDPPDVIAKKVSTLRFSFCVFYSMFSHSHHQPFSTLRGFI